MLTEPLIQHLHQLRLAGMAAALEQQLSFSDLSDRPFEDRLGIMIQHEFTERATHCLAMHLRRQSCRSLPASKTSIPEAPTASTLRSSRK